MIFPRQRKTKYHERTYWYEAVLVSAFLSTFALGVLVGWYI